MNVYAFVKVQSVLKLLEIKKKKKQTDQNISLSICFLT